jgi:hypothetical protein
VSYRLAPTANRNGPAKTDLIARVLVPGGIEDAWVGDDPLKQGKATVSFEGEVAIAKWHKGYRGVREVYIAPIGRLSEVTHALEIVASEAGVEHTMKANPKRAAVPDRASGALARANFPHRSLTLTFGIAPIPDDQTQELKGVDDELQDALEAMGYVEAEETKESEGQKAKAP